MCAPFDTETSNFIMKSAIKPAMMCLIILKRLFFNSEVMLPLWSWLLRPQWRLPDLSVCSLNSSLSDFSLSSFLLFITFLSFFFPLFAMKKQMFESHTPPKASNADSKVKLYIYNKPTQGTMSARWPGQEAETRVASGIDKEVTIHHGPAHWSLPCQLLHLVSTKGKTM